MDESTNPGYMFKQTITYILPDKISYEIPFIFDIETCFQEADDAA